MADLKISQMVDGETVQITDDIPVNRGGSNFRVKVGSAAVLNVGTGIGDVVSLSDDGLGNSQYPSADGSLITNVQAYSITDTIESGSSFITISGSGTIDDPYSIGYTGGGGTGTVDSVNGQAPDIAGDVSLEASDIPYDNSTSGLSSDDVQSAIDEINQDLDDLRLSVISTEYVATSSLSTSVYEITGLTPDIRKFTILLANFSTNGTSVPIVQIGDATSYPSSGYQGSISQQGGTNVVVVNTSEGVSLVTGAWTSSRRLHGRVSFNFVNASTNEWQFETIFGLSDTNAGFQGAGRIVLSGAMTRLRLRATNGTDVLGGRAQVIFEKENS